MTDEQIERRQKLEAAIANLVDVIKEGEYEKLQELRALGFNWNEANELRGMVYQFGRKNYVSGTV